MRTQLALRAQQKDLKDKLRLKRLTLRQVLAFKLDPRDIHDCAGIRILSMKRLRAYRLPSTYLLCKGSKVVYIGAAKNGIARIFDNDHPAYKIWDHLDHLILLTCSDLEIAKKLERSLIKKYRPKLDGKKLSGVRGKQSFPKRKSA